MNPDELRALLQSAEAWQQKPLGTHWEGCERSHYVCMIAKLRDALVSFAPDDAPPMTQREAYQRGYAAALREQDRK